jgi:hypothetical protein
MGEEFRLIELIDKPWDTHWEMGATIQGPHNSE